VTVDGKPVKKPEAARLFRYYKPPATLTAARDPKGRATITTACRRACRA
jgi:23S rRNA pseudouridine2605 synthase